jgi:hypothetical protein
MKPRRSSYINVGEFQNLGLGSRERRMNTLLGQLHRDPMNVDRGKYYGDLMRASVIITDSLPRIRNPGRMLENLTNAFSRRGHCIFIRPPVVSAFEMLIIDAGKTKRVNPIFRGLLHDNCDLKKTFVTIVEKHPELVEICSRSLVGKLKNPDPKVRATALKLIGINREMVGRYPRRIVDMWGDPDPKVRATVMKVINRNREVMGKILPEELSNHTLH